jgi:hypothetical protein
MCVTKVTGMCLVLLLIASAGAHATSHTPCEGVDRSLSIIYKSKLTSSLAKQLRVPNVDVLELMRYGGWSIVYVNAYNSDEVFLFYARSPLHSRYVNTWSGAAGVNEEVEMYEWVSQNIRGIPVQLARCFAWHVTKDRSQ